jgi:hypothetical protein
MRRPTDRARSEDVRGARNGPVSPEPRDIRRTGARTGARIALTFPVAVPADEMLPDGDLGPAPGFVPASAARAATSPICRSQSSSLPNPRHRGVASSGPAPAAVQAQEAPHDEASAHHRQNRALSHESSGTGNPPDVPVPCANPIVADRKRIVAKVHERRVRMTAFPILGHGRTAASRPSFRARGSTAIRPPVPTRSA